MVVERINSSQVSRVSYEPYIPTEAPKPKIPDEYLKDTIQTACSIDADQQHTRPKLEAPTCQPKNPEQVSKELDDLDPNLIEVNLHRMLLECFKLQRDNYETDTELTSEILKKRQGVNEKLQKEYLKQLDEHIAYNKQSEILKWINWVLYGALAIVGLASLVLTLTTAGASLPLALTVTLGLVNGLLSIASGSTTIFKGVQDYKNKKIIGEMEEKKWERTLNSSKIKAGMDDLRNYLQVISENWKDAREAEKNRLEASLSR